MHHQFKNMKQFVLAFLAIIIIASCQNENDVNPLAQKAAADSANYTTIKWQDSIVNFGTIKKGDTIRITFHCKNTGTKPLIITNAKPGCSCTVADYSKEAIPPGGEGFVIGSFNSEHVNQSHVRKTIIVNTNTLNGTEHFLYFEGDISGVESNDKIAQPNPIKVKTQ